MLANIKIEQDKENQTVHRVLKMGRKLRGYVQLISILAPEKYQ